MNIPVGFNFGIVEDEYVPEKKKKKSGKSSSYCAVGGCATKAGMGISFFRIPKLEPKCTQWKEALGFVGNHKYANLSPDQCHSRIRICSLHFASNCFSSENRIHSCAIPSLSVDEFENEFVENQNFQNNDLLPKEGQTVSTIQTGLQKQQNMQTKTPQYTIQPKGPKAHVPKQFQHFGSTEPPPLAPIITMKSESTIDIQPSQITGDVYSVKAESDDSLDSTNFEPLLPNETFQKDQSTQTSIELTPILILKPPGHDIQQHVDQNLNHTKNIEKQVTVEDVYKFFENNYSAEACSLLKAQLDVLEKTKRTTEITGLPINTTLKHISIRKV